MANISKFAASFCPVFSSAEVSSRVFFTALQARSSDKNSVCPSVRLSVKRVNCDKRKKDLSRFLYRTKDNLAWFSEKKNGCWGATHSTWNFGSICPRWCEIADFEPIFARSTSAVTPSEKLSIKTNRKSTTRFPMSLRSSSYIAPKSPKRGSKTQNGRFRYKIALRLKKVCCKVSLCENCQRQSCRAFVYLTIRVKMIGVGDRFYLKFWVKLTALKRNRRFSIYFAVGPQP